LRPRSPSPPRRPNATARTSGRHFCPSIPRCRPNRRARATPYTTAAPERFVSCARHGLVHLAAHGFDLDAHFREPRSRQLAADAHEHVIVRQLRAAGERHFLLGDGFETAIELEGHAAVLEPLARLRLDAIELVA